jgi:phosphate starvation-inducible PhoH-like protein
MSRREKKKVGEEQKYENKEQALYKRVIARTENQQHLIDTINSNTITFCNGQAGSGKTHISVGLAVESLRRGRVKRIVISRPLVQAGEDVGCLPGDTISKLNPFLMPLFDEFQCFITKSELEGWINGGLLEICPLGFMRGRTFNYSFIILDEAQNASTDQLKMFLTRLGRESIMVINGDTAQSDLPYWKAGGLEFYMEILEGVDSIGISKLEACDIIRNPIIARILERVDDYNKKNSSSEHGLQSH